MKRNATAILIVIFLFICMWKMTAPAKQTVKAGFPLSKGSYWVYRGRVKGRETQLDCDTTRPVVQALTWKMEIVETINRGQIIAAVIKGYLDDLKDARGIKGGEIEMARTDYQLIRVGEEKYYLLDGDSMAAALKRLRDRTDSLDGLVEEQYLEFDFPLSRGKVFGDPEQMSRERQEIESGNLERVGWLNVVENERQIKLQDVRGIDPSETVTQYHLRYVTNSSSRETEFVPGIGITKFHFSYHPAGCLILETNVRLVEYNSIN
jgi:hypothetical protein